MARARSLRYPVKFNLSAQEFNSWRWAVQRSSWESFSERPKRELPRDKRVRIRVQEWPRRSEDAGGGLGSAPAFLSRQDARCSFSSYSRREAGEIASRRHCRTNLRLSLQRQVSRAAIGGVHGFLLSLLRPPACFLLHSLDLLGLAIRVGLLGDRQDVVHEPIED